MSDASTHYKFDVAMSCSGCSGALTRVLTKFKESNPDNVSFKVDLDSRTVEVDIKKDAFSDEEIIRTVGKPGKEIASGEKDGVITWDKEQIKEILAKK
ncbi:hypothetical protein SMACR_08246 [Sordaria macrospora]|uniref:WGS project CABT00000000 data, contig 2.56 n=2 Tax=Sordaria macrospora TaxID=5147 RepID=F7W9X0_SORMK|nr:uncharacterized protein SMAC_08246 [Sordaria macrospora k-hell]KAA8631230.1 hypothetical protein SMACR_08246 [Sordaria macrospora]KAH7635870.1 hypothetical protein B0T09DRAFT_405800 [Sordaria sp. MPI-SDFR-AT-0083]WPJ64342.1 hypothetical protein SMAC4_08246 [Sordaria macrospora]CCC05237.1 unnamed protein product [Sordaria macrospora k-hell]